MAVYKCKMCGGNLEIGEESKVCECDYCGSKQTVPLLDNEKKVNLFSRANKLRLNCEFDKAASVYESIVAEFQDEAEAYWGVILCEYGIEYVDDPLTGKKVPTCHRSSFNSIFENANLEFVMENSDALSRSLYRDEAKIIEEIRLKIIEVSSKENPYDIFICYKESDENGNRTIDSVMAQDIYTELVQKGYKVFFSRITLENKLGQEYEPYIFAALNSAKIMLAFGTSYEHYNAVWVKNEWRRYLSLIERGEKKFLIPCYKDIDAYDMPAEFKKLQGIDLGKVGSTQDLIRGIDKIIRPEGLSSSNDVINSAIIREMQSSTTITIKNYLDRGYMILEDKDFDRADEFFEKVLDLDPTNVDAYLGKTLALFNLRSINELKEYRYIVRVEKMSPFKRAVQFSEGNNSTINEICEIIETKKVEEAKAKAEEQREKAEEQRAKAEEEEQKEHLAFFEKYAHLSDEKIYSWEKKDIDILTIPYGIKEIGDYAFSHCKSLVNITIPNSVAKIGRGAFSSCESLTSITIPNSVVEIGNDAFEFCKSLANITIPNSVAKIGRGAFSFCGSLTSVVLPDNLVEICDRTFEVCVSLTNIVLPNSLEKIGDDAFAGCESLASITIPDSVEEIGRGAFYFCEALKSIAISKNVKMIGAAFPLNCAITIDEKNINYKCENGILTSKDGKRLVQAYAERNIDSITINDSVEEIGDYAFYACESLTTIIIPNGVVKVGESAFKGCTSLLSMTLPKSVVEIGDNAFEGCESLTDIAILGNVLNVGNEAFLECYKLKMVCISKRAKAIIDRFDKEQQEKIRFGYYEDVFFEKVEKNKFSADEMSLIFEIITKQDELLKIGFFKSKEKKVLQEQINQLKLQLKLME